MSRRVAHLSGDMSEPDGLPRRRAFSLSFSASSTTSHIAQHSVVHRDTPLLLKSSSVSSVASRHVDDAVGYDDNREAIGKLLNSK